MAAETFHAVRVLGLPGQIVLQLTHPWEGLEAGTEIQLLAAGRDTVQDIEYREVYVASGPHQGQRVRGRA